MVTSCSPCQDQKKGSKSQKEHCLNIRKDFLPSFSGKKTLHYVSKTQIYTDHCHYQIEEGKLSKVYENQFFLFFRKMVLSLIVIHAISAVSGRVVSKIHSSGCHPLS